MKRVLSIALAMTMATGLFAGCGAASSTAASSAPASSSEAASSEAASSEEAKADGIEGEVTGSGSSALLPLAQVAAEKFMAANPNCSIVMNGGGSGTGLQNVADASVDIGNSDLFAEEKLDADVAAGLVDHKVCTVTMAAIVNEAAGVTDLTKAQLIDIFTGVTKNWSEVGGNDIDIMLVTRPSSSGTRATFKTYAMDGAEEATGITLDNSGALLAVVEENEGAVGYVALSYLMGDLDVVPVAIDGVEPTMENTYNGTYTVWSYEHMYTNGEGSDAAQAFLGYMMSEEFAPEIEAMGYGAASKLSAEAIATHE